MRGAGAWGGGHWSVAVPLVHTGYVYARSGRVVLAEGLYREALRRLAASVDGAGGFAAAAPAAPPTDAHPSTVALAAWRFSQLLSVLPRRDSEAARWADLAQDEWRRGCGAVGAGAVEALGTRDALSGKGHHGCLVASNLLIGRVFPGAAPRP